MADRDILKSIGAEFNANPPGILGKTRRTKGPARAQSQKVAILLSKARQQGAKTGPRKK